MPARSLIGAAEDAARRFYATTMRGEVSDADVRGYLRAASQIADVWQRIDEQLADLRARGVAPWEAYARLRPPLAFIRAARAYQVFVQQLLAADAAADPATAGYLPRVTFDQANALCHQILPNLQHAVAALSDPAYVPAVTLPLELGPRIEAEGQACPLPHLEGMLATAREVREWAAGLIAEYGNAVEDGARGASSGEASGAPPAVAAHLAALNARLAEADCQLRFATDLVGQISQGGPTAELHEQAEDSLWDAMRTYFLLNQAVGMPELLLGGGTTPAPGGPAQARRRYRDRHIRPADLWRVAAPSARSELRRTKFGAEAMRAMWHEMRGILPAGHEFHWDFRRGRLETARRFGRSDGWHGAEG